MSIEQLYEAAAKAVTQWWADNQGYGNPEDVDAQVAKAAVDAVLEQMGRERSVNDDSAYGLGTVLLVDEPGTYAIVGPL